MTESLAQCKVTQTTNDLPINQDCEHLGGNWRIGTARIRGIRDLEASLHEGIGRGPIPDCQKSTIDTTGVG